MIFKTNRTIIRPKKKITSSFYAADFLSFLQKCTMKTLSRLKRFSFFLSTENFHSICAVVNQKKETVILVYLWLWNIWNFKVTILSLINLFFDYFIILSILTVSIFSIQIILFLIFMQHERHLNANHELRKKFSFTTIWVQDRCNSRFHYCALLILWTELNTSDEQNIL